MADLTIIMPSWNKEKYIAEALDSIFAQKTSFSYEIVVVDDHSTDRTLEIVAEYERRHPGVITVLRSDVNLKLFRNVRRAYAICKTPYFCVLDPDDYWTDARHLDKALTFLAGHPDYTIYSAGIEHLSPDGTRRPCGFPAEPVDSSFRDFLYGRAAIAFTQTCVYRNVVFSEGLPPLVENPSTPEMERSFRGDSFRNFLHIRLGKAHFEPGVEACYRLTDEGVYQGLDEEGRLRLNAQLYADLWRFDGCAHRELRKLADGFSAQADACSAAARGCRKRYVLLDVYDFSNRGDWLMLEAMLEQVRKRLPQAVPVISRFAYDQNMRWCGERGIVPLDGGRFYGLLKPGKLKRKVPPRCIDYVLFSPGFRFSDQIDTSLGADYYREYFGQFTKRGRKIFFMPQAFGPFETQRMQACMKEVFRIPDRIYVRDGESLRYLEALVGKSDRVAPCPDFTCLFHGERYQLPYPERGYAVLIPNFNMALGTDRETSSRYEDFMVAVADHLAARGEKVVLLNHEDYRDEAIAMRINCRLKVPAYLASRLTGGECKSVISGAKLVVSSRFHGVVSGLTDGVPTLCTSWSHKYGELIHELGCDGNCLDVTDLPGALKTVDDALSAPSRYAPSAEALESLRRRVDGMWREIFADEPATRT